MKKVMIITSILLSGCAAQPIQYDLAGNYAGNPININKNIPEISINNFTYEPHRNISQYATSGFGCVLCQSDGSWKGFVFQQPVKDIIQAEAELAFKEIAAGKSNGTCELNGQIHAVGWNSNNSDTTVDITYILKIGESAEYVKRVKGLYDGGIFEMQKIEKIWAKPTRASVQELVWDKNFVELLHKKCT
ncbi:hypothetical protein HC000_17255 [Pseudoalteromonas sp. MIP2626]|jgi:hypothetical protein|uniref:hypothetical protein n=1 Tax=Pseudoalteromonas sp. MIP2626 TaxID=2705464 RepID=UPI0015C98C89|nr:hypothetical protein [Pseudoalteromonas sp. MIP2626]NYR14177.1 hypothetical protein [Pseudoalteromonas sp. MIP2626]